MIKTVEPIPRHSNKITSDDELLLQSIRRKRSSLEKSLAGKLVVNPDLNRRLVSFQGNKRLNRNRWCSYREGFSSDLVRYVLEKVGPKSGHLFDPFCGSGTALFKASDLGLDALGIELLPNSIEIVEVRQQINLSDATKLAKLVREFRDEKSWQNPGPSIQIEHLRITEGAYPLGTESSLGRYIYEARHTGDIVLGRVLMFAAMCVLESVSYTRKDGQYLRWDSRSGRNSGKKPFMKATLPSFSDAICVKLAEIAEDVETENVKLRSLRPMRRGQVTIMPGSCLELLPTIESNSCDGVITSPPYCNRYDYTRTYALELAFLGVSESRMKELRQSMLTCTVENREKTGLNTQFTPDVWETGRRAFDTQGLLQSILVYLDACRERRLLNNPGIARMVRNYFLELAIVIADCRRVLRSGAPLVMVNDNVQYQGVPIPVDLILSDIARKAGFDVDKIWILPMGKGNSSQQMSRHGRNEARKCVYVWRRAISEV